MLPSLQEYVLVAQDMRRVEVWRREHAGWASAVFEAGTRVELESIRFILDFDELYNLAGVSVR